MNKYHKPPYTTVLLIASALTPLLWQWRETHTVLWAVSWYTVFILMLIRPLSNLFPSVLFFRHTLPYRKELGILSASIVVTNALYNYIPMGTSFFERYFSLPFWDLTRPSSWGHLAELAGVLLLITSNKFSQKKLKRNWKRVQRLSYLYYYGAAVLLISYGKTDVLITAIITAVIATLAALKKRNLPPFKK